MNMKSIIKKILFITCISGLIVLIFSFRKIFIEERLTKQPGNINWIILGSIKSIMKDRVHTITLFPENKKNSIFLLTGERFLKNFECKKDINLCKNIFKKFDTNYFLIKDKRKANIEELSETEAGIYAFDEIFPLKKDKILLIKNNEFNESLEYFYVFKHRNIFKIKKVCLLTFKFFLKEDNLVILLDDKKKEIASLKELRPTTKTTVIFLDKILSSKELNFQDKKTIFISDQPFAVRQFVEIKKYFTNKNIDEVHKGFFKKCEINDKKIFFNLLCPRYEINLFNLKYLKLEIKKYFRLKILKKIASVKFSIFKI